MFGNLKQKVLGVLSVLVMLGASVAQAAVPAGTEAAFTAILTDGTTIAGYAAPVVLGLLGLTIAFKLIKRFGNKA